MNSTTFRRLQALALDWLVICGYLVVLALVAMFFYFLLLDGIPKFNVWQSQLLATFTTVVPVLSWFAVKEAQIPFATFGKSEMEITVKYTRNPWISAFIRNILKFLPWQLAHMGVIGGIYSEWENPAASFTVLVSLFLALTYVLQVIVTPSHRHLPDLVAGTRIERLPS